MGTSYIYNEGITLNENRFELGEGEMMIVWIRNKKTRIKPDKMATMCLMNVECRPSSLNNVYAVQSYSFFFNYKNYIYLVMFFFINIFLKHSFFFYCNFGLN